MTTNEHIALQVDGLDDKKIRRLTEKRYAHLAPSYVADTIRASFPTLGIVCPSKVVQIPQGHKGQ